MTNKEKLWKALTVIVDRMNEDGAISNRQVEELTALIEPTPAETDDKYEARMLDRIHRVVRDISPCAEYLEYIEKLTTDPNTARLANRLFWRYYDMKVVGTRRDLKELRSMHQLPDGSLPTWVQAYDTTRTRQNELMLDDFVGSFGPRPTDGGGLGGGL